MKEPEENIGLVCPDYIAKAKKSWQQQNANTIIQVGGHVKITFSEGEKKEHMWVKVVTVTENNIITGILRNEPFLVRNIVYGAKVQCEFTDIILYIPPRLEP